MALKGLEQAFDRAWARKRRFFAVFMVVVTLTYAFLYVIDFIPEAPSEKPASATQTDAPVVATQPVVEEETRVASEDPTPDEIIFDSLGKSVAVLNPTSSDVATLDNALLSGVVRHPDSADLLSEGTVFLFGHSSYLPVVHNKNFQAFNGIKDLKWGDKVRLRSSDYEYVYRVDRVYEVKATSAEVVIASETHKLTLVTCNTFGSKEDRFVVEASLVDSYPL